MMKTIKSKIKSSAWFQKIEDARAAKKFIDSPDTLVYVHIGKCGGESVWNAIQSSTLLKEKFNRVKRVHVERPPVLRSAKYLIVVRNPISRAISAFNWRYKLVVVDEAQRNRFAGEYDILAKYRTLNALAETLYKDGVLDTSAAEEFRSIHHLRESISFYLTHLLNAIQPSQIYAVMATESLSKDVQVALGVAELEKVHENATSTDKSAKFLSAQGRANLRRFLSEDYLALEKLLSLSDSTSADKNVLLK